MGGCVRTTIQVVFSPELVKILHPLKGKNYYSTIIDKEAGFLNM
jgi:hypothetical protein